MLIGPHDVTDLHLDIVDRAGEIVKRRAIGPDDHEIADLVGRELDVSFDQVVEDELPAQRDLESQRERIAGSLVASNVLRASSFRRNR